MSDFVLMARMFSVAAHEAVGQTRKYTGEPYWIHPLAVSKLVERVPNRTVAMICAALLHDVLEDTQVRPATIAATFGPTVLNLVTWVTKVSKPADGNRAVRMEIDRQHIAKAPPEAKTIKLADLLDNSATILDRAPGFAKVYLQEKQALLEVLRGGDPALWRACDDVVRKGLAA